MRLVMHRRPLCARAGTAPLSCVSCPPHHRQACLQLLPGGLLAWGHVAAFQLGRSPGPGTCGHALRWHGSYPCRFRALGHAPGSLAPPVARRRLRCSVLPTHAAYCRQSAGQHCGRAPAFTPVTAARCPALLVLPAPLGWGFARLRAVGAVAVPVCNAHRPTHGLKAAKVACLWPGCAGMRRRQYAGCLFSFGRRFCLRSHASRSQRIRK